MKAKRPTPYQELSREISTNGFIHANRVYWVRIGEELDMVQYASRGSLERVLCARAIRAYRGAWATLTS